MTAPLVSLATAQERVRLRLEARRKNVAAVHAGDAPVRYRRFGSAASAGWARPNAPDHGRPVATGVCTSRRLDWRDRAGRVVFSVVLVLGSLAWCLALCVASREIAGLSVAGGIALWFGGAMRNWCERF